MRDRSDFRLLDGQINNYFHHMYSPTQGNFIVKLSFSDFWKTGCRIFLLVWALLLVIQPISSQAQPSRLPVIVVSDMGTEDWLALAYITQSPKFELLGITIAGNGLAPCPYAAMNAQYLLQMTRTQVPVACSSPWPMNGYASYPKSWREGSISMLGENPTAGNPQQSFEDAPTLLTRLLEQAKAPVDIIAIGAMTNIAIVLKTYPKLKSKIRKITSMGGLSRFLEICVFTALQTTIPISKPSGTITLTL